MTYSHALRKEIRRINDYITYRTEFLGKTNNDLKEVQRVLKGMIEKTDVCDTDRDKRLAMEKTVANIRKLTYTLVGAL